MLYYHLLTVIVNSGTGVTKVLLEKSIVEWKDGDSKGGENHYTGNRQVGKPTSLGFAPVHPVQNTCRCGLSNPNQENEYPWQVRLVNFDVHDELLTCGGVLLSSLTILTAAHCTQGYNISKFEVVVADNDIHAEHGVNHDFHKEDGKAWFTVCKKLEHPYFNSDTLDHDYCILTLCKPLRFRRAASPICLPGQVGYVYDDKVSTVTGWAHTYKNDFWSDILMGMKVTTMENKVCNRSHHDGGHPNDGEIYDSMICAKASGKIACQGDSGGPLITKEPPKYKYHTVIGVGSWGEDCANPDYPLVYARVTHVLPWIKMNIKGKTCKPPG